MIAGFNIEALASASTPILVIMAFLMQRWDTMIANRKAEAAKNQSEQRDIVLKRSAEDSVNIAVNTSRKVDMVHTLVNSQTAEALQTIADFARKFAVLTGNPEDHEIAEKAQVKVTEHKAQQAVVDANPNPGQPGEPRAPSDR